MKSMLYVGATLMIGASIYGFVDYKQTHQKKAFQDMYKEEKKAVAVTPTEEKTVIAEEKSSTPVVKEKKVVNKKIKTEPKEELIPVIEPVSEEEKTVSSVKAIENTTDRPEPASENKVVKKKKVRKEFFSRGRMPEEEVLIEQVKKEPKKSASKE
ncbi:MAG TPA: hypothetical protein PLO99_13695 [Chitinophagaceae bacterium]|nr:hypothetical protein [Chitinophagaceae bacterium]